MKETFDPEQVNSEINEIKKLTGSSNKKLEEVRKRLRNLMENVPGKSVKERQKYISDQLKGKGKGKSYSQIRRILQCVALEMKLKLGPGELIDLHARELLKLKSFTAQKLAYERAQFIASEADKKMTKAHLAPVVVEIQQAILHEANQDVENQSQADTDKTEPGDEQAPSKPKTKKTKSEKQDKDKPEKPFEIDTEKAIEIKTEELYAKLKIHLDSGIDKRFAVDVLKGSSNKWAICKVFADFNKDDIDREALMNLIDPDEELRKVAKKGPRKPAIKRRPAKGKLKTRR